MDIFEYKLKGYCCSQMITAESLKCMGKENEDLIEASAGFCFGLSGVGANCGIVTAAVAMMRLNNPEECTEVFAPCFVDWFKENFGSIECPELLEGDLSNKIEKCPMMIEASMTKVKELMEWD